ncbi:hypothetical protein [Sphaerisporangium fuscum]|uniref:hypothetical protein n=1 Tax=Sphaerisporangium fuscum TaxID=2835868 RepID=UPI001BDCE6A9|nr:hypothetical protein [Sphaerisporangium fuscum]
MRFLARPHQIPPRIAAGAVILNSGISKIGADERTAAGLHQMAAGTYPFLKRLDPVLFVRTLSTTEIALGAALILPVVPSLVAGAALTGFAAGLLGLYLRTPGMRQTGGLRGLRPTPEGTALVKDVWLLGIGAGLVVDELTEIPC